MDTTESVNIEPVECSTDELLIFLAKLGVELTERSKLAEGFVSVKVTPTQRQQITAAKHKVHTKTPAQFSYSA